VITRVFRGNLRPGSLEAFTRYLSDIAVPRFLTSPGVSGLEIHLPDTDTGGTVLCATLWRDVDHVKAFAGEDWAKPQMGDGEDEMVQRAAVSHHLGRPARSLVTPITRFGPEVLSGTRLEIDDASGRVTVDGEPFSCPPRELRLLQALIGAGGTPVTPQDLALQVWPDGSCMTSEDVRRAVHKLRRAVHDHGRRPPLIRNRRGFGYLIDL
jgi:hypothetical protein